MSFNLCRCNQCARTLVEFIKNNGVWLVVPKCELTTNVHNVTLKVKLESDVEGYYIQGQLGANQGVTE